MSSEMKLNHEEVETCQKVFPTVDLFIIFADKKQ